MIRKVISVFLLLIVFSSLVLAISPAISDEIVPTTVASANNPNAEAQAREQRERACREASDNSIEAILEFARIQLIWFGAFFIVDTAISFVEGIEWVGGIAQPADQIVNYLREIWMEALIWGTISSLFNWIAGSLIEVAIGLNQTLTGENPLISYGGRIILQLANFGLVISIIFIGIATILRLQEDKLSVDKLLFKLVIGIIFVNLTIPMALAITDIGTRITDVVYRSSSPCPVSVTHQFTAVNLYDGILGLLLATGLPETAEIPEENPPEGFAIFNPLAWRDWVDRQIDEIWGYIVQNLSLIHI